MKRLLLSHIADPDGVTPIILSQLVWEEFDYVLLEPHELMELWVDYQVHGILEQYDQIFITDLSVNEAFCEMITPDLSEKVKIFDHHLSSIACNHYPFVFAYLEDEKKEKMSAAILYYQYLQNFEKSPLLQKDIVKTYVNHVRDLDVWIWQEKQNFDAMKLGNLFDIYGYALFIDYYRNAFLTEDIFSFPAIQEELLRVEQARMNRYIEKKKDQIYGIQIDHYQVGVVFAEQYRSELGNQLARDYEDIYDFIIVIYMGRGISYRGIKEIDLSSFARIYGGGGHKKAAGSPILEETMECILKQLWTDQIKIKQKPKKSERKRITWKSSHSSLEI